MAQGETEAAFAQFDWVLSVDMANTCANEHRRALNRSLNAAVPASGADSLPGPSDIRAWPGDARRAQAVCGGE